MNNIFIPSTFFRQNYQNLHDDYHQHDHQVRILGDPDIHVNEGSSLRLHKSIKELKKKKRRRKEGSPIDLKRNDKGPMSLGLQWLVVVDDGW